MPFDFGMEGQLHGVRLQRKSKEAQSIILSTSKEEAYLCLNKKEIEEKQESYAFLVPER